MAGIVNLIKWQKKISFFLNHDSIKTGQLAKSLIVKTAAGNKSNWEQMDGIQTA